MVRAGFFAVAALAVSLPPALASSDAELQVVFGPQEFVQATPTRVAHTLYFSLSPPAEAPFLLALASAGRNKGILNGIQVFGRGEGGRASRIFVQSGEPKDHGIHAQRRLCLRAGTGRSRHGGRDARATC